jgi:multiple sugar transport system ATP-binding protein
MIGDRDVTDIGAGNRDLGMVFQDYALYPHMTVEQNIGFGLMLRARHSRQRRQAAADISHAVGSVARQLGLDTLLKRKPSQLSGGQRQRVALARAIVRRPDALLLDEPLSALDAQLRASARAQLIRLHQDISSTMVLVTHDQHEALSMATHLVVMKDGQVVQSGTAEELYRHPVNEFVAAFVGVPAMNIHTLPGMPGRIGWRAADGAIASNPTAIDPLAVSIGCTLELTEFIGENRLLLCRTSDGAPISVLEASNAPPRRPGEALRVEVSRDRIHTFDRHGMRAEASLV